MFHESTLKISIWVPHQHLKVSLLQTSNFISLFLPSPPHPGCHIFETSILIHPGAGASVLSVAPLTNIVIFSQKLLTPTSCLRIVSCLN